MSRAGPVRAGAGPQRPAECVPETNPGSPPVHTLAPPRSRPPGGTAAPGLVLWAGNQLPFLLLSQLSVSAGPLRAQLGGCPASEPPISAPALALGGGTSPAPAAAAPLRGDRHLRAGGRHSLRSPASLLTVRTWIVLLKSMCPSPVQVSTFPVPLPSLHEAALGSATLFIGHPFHLLRLPKLPSSLPCPVPLSVRPFPLSVLLCPLPSLLLPSPTLRGSGDVSADEISRLRCRRPFKRGT